MTELKERLRIQRTKKIKNAREVEAPVLVLKHESWSISETKVKYAKNLVDNAIILHTLPDFHKNYFDSFWQLLEFSTCQITPSTHTANDWLAYSPKHDDEKQRISPFSKWQLPNANNSQNGIVFSQIQQAKASNSICGNHASHGEEQPKWITEWCSTNL